MELIGEVCSGTGRAAGFMRHPRYSQVLWLHLGRPAYLGTLNVKLNAEQAEIWKQMRQKGGSRIPGFTEGEKTMGGVLLWSARLGESDVLIIWPEKTDHPDDLVEVVAAQGLREKMQLKDGDVVKLIVE